MADHQKALERVLAEIKAKYGKTYTITTTSGGRVGLFRSTGLAEIDAGLNGGFPAGKISTVVSDDVSLLRLFSLLVGCSPSYPVQIVTGDSVGLGQLARKAGGDIQACFVALRLAGKIQTSTDMGGTVKEVLRTTPGQLVVFDAMEGMLPETDPLLDKNNPAKAKVRSLSKALRTCLLELNQYNDVDRGTLVFFLCVPIPTTVQFASTMILELAWSGKDILVTVNTDKSRATALPFVVHNWGWEGAEDVERDG